MAAGLVDLSRVGLDVCGGPAVALAAKTLSVQPPVPSSNFSRPASGLSKADQAAATVNGEGAKLGGAKAIQGLCELYGCCGYDGTAVERNGHPGWLPPVGGDDFGLKTMNSLTGEKEMFRPLEGKKVRWYTCGPTVYDSAHMGHARAYLTFDILRRIMRDFFKYDLFYQINITDIDDKIILRSRQNKLFADYVQEAATLDLPTVRAAVDAALSAAGQKLESKRPVLAADAGEKEKVEFEKATQEHELKLGQHRALLDDVAKNPDSKDAILQAAKEPLMAKLDKEKGHTVTDQSIFNAHARFFEDDYFKDMDDLGVLRPEIVTRISDYMDGRVQRYIEKLEDDGFCYESNGSVYFSIDTFESRGFTYRKLKPDKDTSAAEMAEGEGALASEETEKRNKNDFAVWKKSKPGEPEWSSRWGMGRPGWHIECSVMACEVQGEFLDIHAGGEDLKFPHHDNEMAQAEAYLCRPQWVNYFWHAGHLNMDGLKMSKSLKNFKTIRGTLELHTARQLRLMFCMQQWDKSMNYSDQAIEMARAEERKIKHFFGSLRFHLRHPHSTGEPGKRASDLLEATAACEKAIGDALRDNFNTSKVIEVISKLISECYITYEALPEGNLDPVVRAAQLVKNTLSVLGLSDFDPAPANEAIIPALDAFAELRQDVRRITREKKPSSEILEAVSRVKPSLDAAKEARLDCWNAFEEFCSSLTAYAEGKPGDVLRLCDEVRDRDFVLLSIRLEDRGPDAFLWMCEQREVMEAERADRDEKAAAKALEKIANKLDQKQKELRTAEKAAIKPEEFFRIAGLYSEFDDQGVPSKLSDGEELSAKKKKEVAKELAKQQKDFDKLSKQAGADGIAAFLEKLRSEIVELQAHLGPR